MKKERKKILTNILLQMQKLMISAKQTKKGLSKLTGSGLTLTNN